MNKNQAKRVPTVAVFTVTAEDVDSVNNILGFIEGNVALTRVMLVVRKAFDGTLPTLSVSDTQGGTTETHFTDADLSVEGTDTATTFVPVTGTIKPLYRATKGQWDCEIATGGSTVGEALVVVEYTQLDTEPGLHSLEDN